MIPRILGLDIGEKRLGVAVTDPMGMFAQPLCSIDIRGEKTYSDILSLVSEYNAEKIVVGLPIELSGNHGTRAKSVEKFTNALREYLAKRLDTIPEISMWDERLTTVQAEHVIRGAKLKDKKRREALDRISAAVILESFINCRKNKQIVS